MLCAAFSLLLIAQTSGQIDPHLAKQAEVAAIIQKRTKLLAPCSEKGGWWTSIAADEVCKVDYYYDRMQDLEFAVEADQVMVKLVISPTEFESHKQFKAFCMFDTHPTLNSYTGRTLGVENASWPFDDQDPLPRLRLAALKGLVALWISWTDWNNEKHKPLCGTKKGRELLEDVTLHILNDMQAYVKKLRKNP